MKPSQRTLRLMLTIIPFTLVLSVLLISQQGVNSEQPIPLPNPEKTAEVIDVPIDTSMYEPSRYGIPDYIGGYKVLAVLTSENSECFPEGVMMIELQVTEPSLEAYMASDTGLNVQQAVEALGFSRDTVRWSISGPNGTREELVRQNERWNQARRTNGCVTFGGIPTPQPSDDQHQQSN